MKIKLIFLLLVNLVFSQSSIGDLRRLANQDLDQIRQELQAEAKGSIIETTDDIKGSIGKLMWANCKSCHTKFRASH